MKKKMIYHKLAKYYDLIYLWKDYKKESNTIKKLILKYKKSDGNELLDVACGTGKHLSYLKDNFSCTGVDISKEVLSVARKNVKGVVFKKADMVTLSLNKKFDVITCLFSSIGYIKTYSNLRKAIQNFAKHLKAGGILIIEPWFTKSTYRVGLPHITIYNGENIKIARLNISKIKGNISVMDMHYLIAEKNKDVKHFIDRHELRLFEVDKTLEIMKEVGLQAKFLKRGLMKNRGIYLGIKKL
ncbi:MAG: class I SAM-dependent methyltransferase [Candidatus Nealsonbacteria bacterium]|nr:MAG: class I SAM-dependent methyltransferase [Candidatus Nealsonbacteria bacterium]